jgi:hypothetical protein
MLIILQQVKYFQEAAVSTQHSALSTQHSALSIQQSAKQETARWTWSFGGPVMEL